MKTATFPESEGSSSGRLTSLDAFRGLTLAGMILVNNPGSWEHVYAPLLHATWDGWTPTDLVFPSFVFIVGVAIPLALGKRMARGDSAGAIMAKVFRRTLIIFVIGLLLNAFPFDKSIATLRIPGVLQRIAICYCVASLIFLKVGVKGQLLTLAALLVGYWAAMIAIPVPGVGAGDLSRPNNLAAYIDTHLLSGHTYKTDYDPEGILSTLPAIATTMIGVLAGIWLGGRRPIGEKVAGIFAGGTLCFLLGWSWAWVLPINKALWSSSFTLYSAGLSLLLLGVCAFVIEVLDYKRWAVPFLVFGSNPIVAYALSGILSGVLTKLVYLTLHNGEKMAAKPLLYQHLVDVLKDPTLASLVYALTYVIFWLVIMSVLYRFKIFIRV